MKPYMRITPHAVKRHVLINVVRIGTLALLACPLVGQSDQATIRSGSKTITIQSGKSTPQTHALSTSEFSRQMLAAHNDIRAGKELPPLQWSGELAAYAQKWADSLIARKRAAHNPNSRYGENILTTGLGSSPSTVVREWASEEQEYSYRKNICSGDCGHYTQLVWRSTRTVGCAMAHNSRREIWVCSYDPPGNILGERPY